MVIKEKYLYQAHSDGRWRGGGEIKVDNGQEVARERERKGIGREKEKAKKKASQL